MKNFDVCIFGAGPAAIASSMVLSQAGADVVLVRKPQAFPRTTKPRWETLSPRVEPILQQLGLSDVLEDSCEHRVTAHVSSWGSENIAWESVMKRPNGGNWMINRNTFDRNLSQVATQQGITMLEGDAANIKRGQDLWHVAITGTKHSDVTSRFLIDASGYGAIFARRLGAKRVLIDKLVTQWLVFPTEGDTDKTIRIDSLENGWLFTIRGSHQRLLCFFTDGGLLKTGSDVDIKQAMEERILASPAIRDILGDGSIPPIFTSGTAFASTSTLDRVVGEGWLACGDAAQTYDPLSSQGSYQALLSGYHAGTSLINYHNGDYLAFKDYEHCRQIEFMQYLKKLCKQYRLERRWANSNFWKHRHNLFSSSGVKQLLEWSLDYDKSKVTVGAM